MDNERPDAIETRDGGDDTHMPERASREGAFEGESAEEGFRRPRREPAWRKPPVLAAAAAAALALAAGFWSRSTLAPFEESMEAPPRLPRRVRPAPTPIPSPPPVPTASPAEQAAVRVALSRADAWAAQLKARPQPSLIVCEPQASASAAPEQAFGDGCARWLHFYAAGSPALGGTPLWHRVEYARTVAARQGLKIASGSEDRNGPALKRYRCGPRDLSAIARTTGAARVAVGRLSPGQAASTSDGPLLLSYEVWDVGAKRRLATFDMRGTRASIAAQLPGLARRLSAAGGASQPDVPARCELSPSELASIAVAPSSDLGVEKVGRKEIESQGAALEKLAPRSAVAALLCLYNWPYSRGDARYIAVQKHLLRLAPRNALAWSSAAWLKAVSLRREKALDTLASRFPDSALMCAAQGYRARLRDRHAEAVKWLWKAVVLSPRDAVWWRESAEASADQAQAIRRSRWSSQIPASEWRWLRPLYNFALFASARSASLDASSGNTWLQMCQAATFERGGDDPVALGALWKGLAAEPAHSGLHGWALEMLQPKWGLGQVDKLRLIASRIECIQPLFENLHTEAMQSLVTAGLNAEGNAMLTRAIYRFQDQARIEPQNPSPHYHLGYLAKDHGIEGSQDETAVREFGEYLKLAPWDVSVRYSLGWMLQYRVNRLAEAKREYALALKAFPDYPNVLSAQADLIVSQAPGAAAARKEARGLLRRAIEISDSGFYHVQLGRLFLAEGRRAEARAAAQAAIARGYTNSDPLFDALRMSPAPGPRLYRTPRPAPSTAPSASGPSST